MTLCLGLLLLVGCAQSRTQWTFERDLIAADGLADQRRWEEAELAYREVAERYERDDLLVYIRYRIGRMLEQQGRHEEALRVYDFIARNPNSIHDHRSSEAMYRAAELRWELEGPEVGEPAMREALLTYPYALFADDALQDLVRYHRSEGDVAVLVDWLSVNYDALRFSESADNIAYTVARLLHEDLGRYEAAMEVYSVLILRFGRSGFRDDAIWHTAGCLRALGRIDEEYRLLLDFVGGREVSWVMADYESSWYKPSFTRMAEIHEERGELQLAIDVWLEMIRLYPLSLDNDDYLYHVMELQAEMGDIKGMRQSQADMERNYDSRWVGRGRQLLSETLERL